MTWSITSPRVNNMIRSHNQVQNKCITTSVASNIEPPRAVWLSTLEKVNGSGGRSKSTEELDQLGTE